MAREGNKYRYLKVLQEWTGESWEDSCYYDTADKEWRKEANSDRKAYRNENIRVRLIGRREKIV